MVNNKLLAIVFAATIATGAGASGCISKNLYDGLTNNEKTLTLYEDSGDHNNLTKKIIDIKINEIIDELGLYESNNPYIQLDMCCKLQKYMAMNNDYDETMLAEKRGDTFREIYTNDLYNVLVYNRAICTSNSAEFKEVLSKIGIDVKSVFVVSENNESHMCNIVNIGGNYYYFDSTLERTIYDSGVYDQDEVILFCAGMGKDNYEQYYKPIGVVDDNFGSDILAMPQNMSKDDIPFGVINPSIDNKVIKVKK